MNLIEAATYTAQFSTFTAAEQTTMFAALVAGRIEVCDNCQFTKSPGEVCSICESTWADETAAQMDALDYGRHAVKYARF